MATDKSKKDFLSTVKSTSKLVSKTVADTAIVVAENTRDAVVSTSEKISAALDEKKAAADKQRQEQFASAFQLIDGTSAGDFVLALGESPVKLTDFRVKQIKEVFPIPREQHILWADAEFDLRPSGIVATNRGVFIRTNVGLMDGKFGISNAGIDTMTTEEQESYKQHQAQFHSGQSVLLYYSWTDFSASWFVSESELENKALLVEPQCALRFVDVCRAINANHTPATIVTDTIRHLTPNLLWQVWQQDLLLNLLKLQCLQSKKQLSTHLQVMVKWQKRQLL